MQINTFLFCKIYFKEIYAIVNFYVNLSTTSNASYFLDYKSEFWGHLVEMMGFIESIQIQRYFFFERRFQYLKGLVFPITLDYVHHRKLKLD